MSQTNEQTGYLRRVHKFPGDDIERFIQAVENDTLAEYVSFETHRQGGGGKTVCGGQCGVTCANYL